MVGSHCGGIGGMGGGVEIPHYDGIAREQFLQYGNKSPPLLRDAGPIKEKREVGEIGVR